MLDVIVAFIIPPLILGVWVAIIYGTYRAAIAKGRRGWLWSILAFFPLGPLMGPLFLVTMPKVGTAASKGQLIGRTFIIAFLVLAFLVRLAANSVPSPNQLSLEELTACLDLSEQADLAKQAATFNEEANMWEFPTQKSADEYNLLVERYQDGCTGKTYDENDMQELQRSFREPE